MQGHKPLTDENSIQRAIMAEQVKMLVTQSPTGIVMSFLLASFIALVFSELVSGQFVFIWWCVISSFFFLQYLMYAMFTKHAVQPSDNERWYKLIIVASLLGGAVLGYRVNLDATRRTRSVSYISYYLGNFARRGRNHIGDPDAGLLRV